MSQSQSKKSAIATTNLTRRQAMRGLVGGAAAVGAGSIGLRTSSQEVEAIPPAVVAGVGAVALGWAVRDGYERFIADTASGGLSPEALQDRIAGIALTRQSTNASTIIDNENINNGIEQIAYADGKIAAIEALNAGQTEADVEQASHEAVNAYEETVIRNLLETWNESVFEFRTNFEALYESDADEERYQAYADGGEGFGSNPEPAWRESHPEDETLYWEDYEFSNGNTIEVQNAGCYYPNGIDHSSGATAHATWNPNFDFSTLEIGYADSTGTPQTLYMKTEVWVNILEDLETTFQNVRDGLVTWVSTIYSDVQTGEIEVSELITPRERSEMMADEETIAPAIADLIALNASVDPEREVTITLVDDDVTLRGTFSRTANPDGEPLESGETYDPDADLTGDVYFSYDVSQGEGVWSDYQTGVDGGTVTFTTEPPDSVEFLIETTAGETATVEASEVTDEGDGSFTVDISEQVEDPITEIESVEMFPLTTETQFETVLLGETFEILRFEDSDGNEVDSASFEESSEPQTDTNYITQEEWDELESRNQELIEKYEESQSSGLFGGGGFLEGTNSTILIVVAAGLAAVGLLNN